MRDRPGGASNERVRRGRDTRRGRRVVKISRAWWLTGAVSAMLLVAGCGGGGGSSSCGGTGSAGGSSGGGSLAAQQVMTVNWGTEPPSLDPGLASDTTSSNIILNIMDPLVKLGSDLQPVPNLAQSWDISQDGKTVTFHLRKDGKWTNGDPVTADDYVYSWKRTMSPELAA